MISGRDKRAFDAFVRDHSDRLVRTAHLLVGDGGHAEDIVQTALLRTARRWRTARAAPEAYARTVVANLAKDRWRHLGRRPPEAPLATGHEPSRADASDALAERDALLAATRALPQGQRAVLVLRFFEGLRRVAGRRVPRPAARAR
ncbi:sigma-70 family RNA polymerase sigma factor [Nocardioides flavescens]|uniref:Sigma-70 family RNA polymerase sigma factor n=1 Tax=Nocardioides flavescens TaxID=2691959 RepID=A0A6L7ETU2_9ACTN|nr:sigma-70 family RNA polymerase sigma factor [Nocardioides flavescens]MXG89066.1 sigma-70 family RNA polymerase sigma factor [Nocardioides flavescens]